MRILNLFFLLAIAGFVHGQNIGIGTTSPQARLHIKGSGFPESFLYLQSNTGQDAGIRLYEGDAIKWHIYNSSTMGGLQILNTAAQTALFASQATGYVGIGTITPAAQLDINGQLKISGGTPGAGKVLTSDATGLAAWQPLPPAVLALPYVGNANTNLAFIILNEKGIAIEGKVTQTAGAGTGVFGETAADNGRGVRGLATSTTGTTYGVFGESAASNGFGLRGYASSGTGSTYGCWATSASMSGTGVIGENASQTGTTYGVKGIVYSDDGFSGHFTGGRFFVNGNVGIANSDPIYRLDVKAPGTTSTAIAAFRNSVGDIKITLRQNSNGSGAVQLYNSAGDVGTSLVGEGDSFINGGRLAVGANSYTGTFNVSANSTIAVPQIAITEEDAEYARLMFRNTSYPTKQWTIAAAPTATDGGARMYFYYNNGTTGANNLAITGDGRLGIGIEIPSQDLDVSGNARIRSITSGTYFGAVNRTSDGTLTTATSDARLKTGIQPLQNSLDKVLQLQGVSFLWKDNPQMGRRIGFVAQDFEKVLPELSFTNPADGYKGINYAEVTAVLVEAMKALKAENDLLRVGLQQLQMEVKALSKK